MTTPNPRGYPHKSAIADLEFAIVEVKPHWSLDPVEYERQKRSNINANPIWYMPPKQRDAVNSKLDSLGF